MTDSIHKEATVMPDKTFPLNVFSVQKIRLHWHEHMEWIYVKKGRVQLQINNTIAVLEADELAFVNSRQLHEAIPLDEDTELVAIVFNEVLIRNSGLDSTEARYFEPILNHSLLLPNFLKSDDSICRSIISSVSRLLQEFDDKKTGFELFIKGELYRLFGLIIRHHPELWNIQYAARLNDDMITTFLKYLRENSHKPITVTEAAKLVNLSPNHFCSVFKKTTGRTLIEYINLLRVNEAERLLKETVDSIEEIAFKIGFSNSTYFGRVIKKYRNMTPTHLRNYLKKTSRNHFST